MQNSTPGSRVATVVSAASASAVDIGGGQVGAVVDAGGAQLDGQLYAGTGAQLIAVHAQPESGRADRR